MKTILLISLFIFNFYAYAVEVNTPNGNFQGYLENNSYYFKNIPYAQPPINELRWKAPRALQNKSSNKKTMHKDIKCAQLNSFFSGSSDDNFDTPIGSEDCLYLNISTPENYKSENKKPVFVWIFGGSNRAGYATDPLYQGGNLAKTTDAIVVTVNYRLGHFGAFYNEVMHTENKKDNSGNYVTLDLIMALNWIEKNIESFGGDKANITVGGQSAGCINLWGLILSPLAKDKFAKAYCSAGIPNNYPTQIAEKISNDFIANAMVMKKVVKRKKDAKKVIKKLNPNLVQKLLRSLSTEEVLSIPHISFPVQHISDGYVFPRLGLTSLLSGHFNKVKLMLGSNSLEASYFTQFAYLDVDKRQFWNMLNGKAPLDPLYHLLESDNFDNFMGINTSTTKLLSELIDYVIHTTQFYFPKIYRYEFGWHSNFEPWKSLYGATHGLEIPFLFNNFELGEEHFLNILKKDSQLNRTKELSQLYSSYMKGFLHSGNPNEFISEEKQEWKAWKSARLAPYKLIFNQESEKLEKKFPNPLIGLEALKISGHILTSEFND